MRLHVIGAGKVGRSLAKAYHCNGGKLGFLVNRSVEHAKESVSLVGVGIPLSFNDLKGKELDGILAITVPDRKIEEMVEFLNNYCDLSGVSFAFHCSGYMDSRVLSPLSIPYACVHPIFAFGRVVNPEELEGVYYDVSGNEKGLEYARELVRSLKGIPLKVNEDQKKVLHLAAVISSNFGLTLMAQAVKLCQMVGVDIEKALLRLMKSVLSNVEIAGLKKSATGPVVRGDWNVVNAERELLKLLDPDSVDLYDKLVEITRREFGAEYPQDNGI